MNTLSTLLMALGVVVSAVAGLVFKMGDGSVRAFLPESLPVGWVFQQPELGFGVGIVIMVVSFLMQPRRA